LFSIPVAVIVFCILRPTRESMDGSFFDIMITRINLNNING